MMAKRKYSLGIVVVLILFCWPAAIVYYYTRPEIEERVCTKCGRKTPLEHAVCPYCGHKFSKAQ